MMQNESQQTWSIPCIEYRIANEVACRKDHNTFRIQIVWNFIPVIVPPSRSDIWILSRKPNNTSNTVYEREYPMISIVFKEYKVTHIQDYPETEKRADEKTFPIFRFFEGFDGHFHKHTFFLLFLHDVMMMERRRFSQPLKFIFIGTQCNNVTGK